MASPTRRLSQVYVELPLMSPRATTTNKAKENMPTPATKSGSGAHRLSKANSDEVLKDKSADANTKPSSGQKRKADTEAGPEATKAKKLKAEPNTNDVDERRCHQCARKMALTQLVRCTRLRRGAQCNLHYCKACLKNRYGEDADTIKNTPITAKPGSEERTKHVAESLEFLFSCPRCQDDCNCRICRKLSGLPATGNLSKDDGQSARDQLKANPLAKTEPKETKEAKKATAPKESTVQSKKNAPTKTTTKPAAAKEATTKKASAAKSSSAVKAAAAKDATSTKASTSKPVVEKPVIPSPPAIPRLPEWAEMITELDRKAVEDRIYLREFVVRFGPLLGIAKIHMDALDDFDHLPYAAAKAIVISILDVLSIEDESARHRKTLAGAVRDARASNTPARLWAVLEDLRNIGLLECPDPAEADPDRRETRHSDAIAQTEQLMPPLLALCELAIRGGSLHDDLDEQSRLHPQYNRDQLYGPLKEVNEAWAEEKKILQGNKPTDAAELKAWKPMYKKAETKHREAVAKIEQSHYESDAAYAPRFGPLGRDRAGRVYYLLSTQKVKKLPTETELDEHKRWAWFVAVWGTPLEKTDDDEADDHCAERWMGVSEPSEIRHTAKWLLTHALNDEYCVAMGKPSPSMATRRAGDAQTSQVAESPDPLRMTSPLSSLSDDDASSLSSLTDAEGDDEDAEGSDMSSLTSLEDDAMDVDRARIRKRVRAERKAQKSVARQMAKYYGPKPTVSEVKAMCKQMNEFADFLEWKLAADVAR